MTRLTIDEEPARRVINEGGTAGNLAPLNLSEVKSNRAHNFT